MNMKFEEAANSSGFEKFMAYFYIPFMMFWNYSMNPMITHLNKRGHFTSYWVVNDDIDIDYLLKDTTVMGILTDRPVYVS